MDEVLNKLEEISERLHRVEKRCQQEEENRTVITKRVLLLDRKMDILGSQAKKKVTGISNTTFDEEPFPCTSGDISENDIALKEMSEAGGVAKCKFSDRPDIHCVAYH